MERASASTIWRICTHENRDAPGSSRDCNSLCIASGWLTIRKLNSNKGVSMGSSLESTAECECALGNCQSFAGIEEHSSNPKFSSDLETASTTGSQCHKFLMESSLSEISDVLAIRSQFSVSEAIISAMRPMKKLLSRSFIRPLTVESLSTTTAGNIAGEKRRSGWEQASEAAVTRFS